MSSLRPQSPRPDAVPQDRTVEASITTLTEELRAEGVAVGTAELLDSLAAIQTISWSDREQFKAALRTTLAKSPDDSRIFDLVFERFFFRATERNAIADQHGNDQGKESQSDSDNADPDGEAEAGEQDADAEPQFDQNELRDLIAQAARAGDEAALRDLARLAIAAFGGTQAGSGFVGVDVQRIRRATGLKTKSQQAARPDMDGAGGEVELDTLTAEQLRNFERILRIELEQRAIARAGELPPARPLTELDRLLPTGQAQDLAQIHRVLAQLRRRLATQGHENRGRSRSSHVDLRRTMRASLATGGVPIELSYRPKRPRRPELFVLCDVSTSVASSAVFFLSVVHALHDSFRKLRSFVFVERVSEVTDVFAHVDDFSEIAAKLSNDAGVADVSGYTDYGRVWAEFLAAVESDLHPRATVIVLGDARTNGRPPRDDLFARVAEKAGRTFWLNPEPQLYWDYGDSVISRYADHARVFECWTTRQLELFVQTLARDTDRAN